MDKHTNWNRCLFGGALVAAGLVTHEANAQEFVFVDTTATAFVNDFGSSDYGDPGLDSFSGPGPWGVSSSAQNFFNFGQAYAWGAPTRIGAFAAAYYYEAEVSVNSRFTVTSNVFATHFSEFGQSIDSIVVTDLSTGSFLAASDNGRAMGFELLAEHEYRLSYSASAFGSMLLAIPAPVSAVPLGLGVLLASRRRRC